MFRYFNNDPKYKYACWSNGTLKVQYHSGDMRTCYNVSKSEYEDFLKSNYREIEFKRLQNRPKF